MRRLIVAAVCAVAVLPPVPEPRSGTAAAALPGIVFSLGNETAQGASKAVYSRVGHALRIGG